MLGPGALLVLGLIAGGLGPRLGRLDLGGRDPATLSASTADFLARYPRRVAATYFVSSRELMPSRLRGLEESVVRVLAALQRASAGRFAFTVADPSAGGGSVLARAAGLLVSPLTVPRVLDDAHRQQQVWSSLVLEPEGNAPIVIHGLGPDRLPLLQELVVRHLDASAQPPSPVFAVAAPEGYAGLASELRQYGQVIEVDLDRQPAIPPEADVLFWVQPATADPARCRQLERFVARGRSAVLAGSAYAVECGTSTGGSWRCRTRLLPEAWAALLQSVGLRPAPDLLLDRSSGPEPAFLLRCLPGFRDMRSFAAPARGMLRFEAASALEVDAARVTQLRCRAEVVATTTEDARVMALPEGGFAPPALESGLEVGKQNLMVLLKPEDPARGQILALASASPFADGLLQSPQYAHGLFLRDLVRTFAAPRRLIQGRVEQHGPRPVALPGPAARLAWRLAVVLLVPLALLLVGFRRGVAPDRTWTGGARAVAVLQRALPAAVAAVLLVAAARLLPWAADLTAEGRNTVSDYTRRSLERHRADLQAELVIQPRAILPAALKAVEAQVGDLLAGCGIELRVLRPEHLSLQEQQDLRYQGVRPFPAERIAQDSTVAEAVWSGLRLRLGERVATIPRLDRTSSGHLDYLLAAAVARLEQGRAPQVAVAADLPRLTPAEAMEDYQRRNLTPPSGVDVYRQLQTRLREYGYQVVYVDPQGGSVPADTDVLLWMQPRRDSSRFCEQLSRYLAGGGQAVVAVQHFNIQQRQYRAGGFQSVYWPQPQFQDVDRYLRAFGVEQVREVLMDQVQSHLALDTQVNRGPSREYDAQEVALPFLIRVVPGQLARDAAITRHLGDLLFAWGNRFAVDAATLSAAGLRSEVLVSTSSQAWAYAWQGGFLSPEVLTPGSPPLGPQPLCLLLQGRFPVVGAGAGEPASDRLAVLPPEPGQREGRLLLIGCSEMFKDPLLDRAGFQHAQLLLNAVALLGRGPDFAELQSRHPAVRGFVPGSPADRAVWRLAAIGGGPLLFLLYGWARFRRGRRSPALSG